MRDPNLISRLGDDYHSSHTPKRFAWLVLGSSESEGRIPYFVFSRADRTKPILLPHETIIKRVFHADDMSANDALERFARRLYYVHL